MTHTASCHCGAVRLEVDGEANQGLACNCSICSRKGSLLWFVPKENVRFFGDQSDVASYTFNKHVIQHRFCKTCGMHPYGEGVDPSGKAMVAVNLRCVEGLEIASIPVVHYDGRSA